jgi:hypothetical protein
VCHSKHNHTLAVHVLKFAKLQPVEVLLRLLVTANVIPRSRILVALMMEAMCSSETSALTRATLRNIPDGGIFHILRKFTVCNSVFQNSVPVCLLSFTVIPRKGRHCVTCVHRFAQREHSLCPLLQHARILKVPAYLVRAGA